MEPIYDRSGQVVGWLENEDIYHLNGVHAGVLDDDNVYSNSGKHLGIFTHGFFRDHQGAAVAFLDGASNGPLMPLQALPPIPPLTSLPPLPPLPELPPLPAPLSMSWGIHWKNLMNG